jgi:hypothetical protein
MSKKSRKRNKKILGALAAGLGAVALMKRKKAASMSGMDDAGIGVTHPALSAINKASNVGANVGANAGGGTFAGGIHQGKTPKGDIVKRMRINAINTAEGPPSIDNPYRAPVRPRGRLHSNFKHGGSVTGAAKRGFGRALMKGKK